MVDTGEPQLELQQLQKIVQEQRHVMKDEQVAMASQTWLKPQLDSPEGTKKVYSLMERMVGTPNFLLKLTSASNAKPRAGTQKEIQQGNANVGPDVTQAEFWEDGSLPADDDDVLDPCSEGFEKVSREDSQASAEPLDSYVLVEKEDVLEAIGTFVAAYLVSLPEAQKMKPEELQKAVGRALKDLQQSRMRRLWGWGRCIYRCIAFSYGAFSVYENPWLVRALLAAIWTASKLMFGLLV